MFNLELQDWLYILAVCLAAILCVTLLKILYSAKSHVPIPTAKPRIAWLPKYALTVTLPGAETEDEITERMTRLGFRERNRDRKLVYSRGSELGDFSIKLAKIVVTVDLPLAAPLTLRVEYGTAFGAAFDTGDLWKFCRELVDLLESNKAN